MIRHIRVNLLKAFKIKRYTDNTEKNKNEMTPNLCGCSDKLYYMSDMTDSILLKIPKIKVFLKI